MRRTSHDIAVCELDDTHLAYRKAGRGPLLILIHGAEADHRMFLPLMAALEHRYTVVAYDQRDSGQTWNRDLAYGVEELADDAAGLIRHLAGDRGETGAHVFGTSLGGLIAQALAARHGQVVNRLVLASTWRAGRRVAEFNPDGAAELVRLRVDPKAHAASIASYFFTPEYLRSHPEAVDMFRGSVRSEPQQQRRARMQAQLPEVDLSAVSVPTLLLAGSADRLIPSSATFELQAHIPQARTELINGLPHVGVLDAPKRVATALHAFFEDPVQVSQGGDVEGNERFLPT